MMHYSPSNALSEAHVIVTVTIRRAELLSAIISLAVSLIVLRQTSLELR